jgi:hypothetical protein
MIASLFGVKKTSDQIMIPVVSRVVPDRQENPCSFWSISPSQFWNREKSTIGFDSEPY